MTVLRSAADPHVGHSVVGVEDPHIYDGALYWECLTCKTRWHRWPEGHRLYVLAEPFVNGKAA